MDTFTIALGIFAGEIQSFQMESKRSEILHEDERFPHADFTTGSSWTHSPCWTVNLKVTSVWHVLHISLHYWQKTIDLFAHDVRNAHLLLLGKFMIIKSRHFNANPHNQEFSKRVVNHLHTAFLIAWILIAMIGFQNANLPNNCRYNCTESVREHVCSFHLFSATHGRR